MMHVSLSSLSNRAMLSSLTECEGFLAWQALLLVLVEKSGNTRPSGPGVFTLRGVIEDSSICGLFYRKSHLLTRGCVSCSCWMIRNVESSGLWNSCSTIGLTLTCSEQMIIYSLLCGAQRFPIIYCMKPIISLNLTVFFKTQCSNMRYTLLYNRMNWLLVIEQWTSSVFVSVSFFRYKYSHILSHSPFLFTLQCHLSIFLSVHVGFYLVKWVSCNRTLLNLVF